VLVSLKIYQKYIKGVSNRFHEFGIRSYVEEIRKERNLNEGKGKTVGQGARKNAHVRGPSLGENGPPPLYIACTRRLSRNILYSLSQNKM